MYNNKYIMGLDIGISSVGWGLLALDEKDNPYKIIDVGSRIFTPGEVEKTGDSRAKERREKRGTRRVTRRREFRLDRVRNLLYENGYLIGEVNSNLVSEKNIELTTIFNNMLDKYYKNNNTNPYKLKVKALDKKLSNEELSIILVHYAKKRGYKSNREEASDSDSGKVISAIKENEKIMKDKNYRTISEMYIKDEKFKDKIKNSPGNYKISVTNEMYLEEINKVLDSQIKYGLINEKFKNEYLEIYNSRRNYAKGPGGDSAYGGDLITKMTGKCNFDNELRAPKRAYSSELFVALTKLVNLKYKVNDGIYETLSNVEIKSILKKAQDKKVVTYKELVKILNKENISFKDLSLSKKEHDKVIEDLKRKININKEAKLDINKLSQEDKNIYNEIYEDKILSKTLIELKGYHTLKDAITKSYCKEIWEEVRDNIDFLDELALYCTNYKVNEDILNKIKESNIIDKKFGDIEFVKSLPNFKDHLMLSTNIIRRLIPIMSRGITYDKAMQQLGYIHSCISSNIEKKDLLVPVCTDENITNQRVIRSLTQTRKIINAIIKKYGTPKAINIETARELTKSYKERREIEKNNLEKQEENEKNKKYLVGLGLFPNTDKISSNDLLKYKLWKEQNEFCGYSMRKIKIEELFKNNIVQIDHILPYSRTYNDNYLNKTLVYTKENQEKGNRTPYEWLGKTSKWDEYESYINSLAISKKKKDNYLLKKLDYDIEKEMREQNLNDTKYISRELSYLIKTYLNVEKVNMFPGAITSKLRARWGFNRLTHSYLSRNYMLPKDMKTDVNKDRSNHLHHALDALVIASITPSLQQKITLYEKFSRYIDGVTRNELENINIDNGKEILGEYYNDETGEIDDIGFKEYLKEQIANENIYFNKHNVSKLEFPLPYEKFTEEAKLRVYEQDLNTLIWGLKNCGTYTKEEIKNIHTLTPSIAKNKISGKMHEETYYGIKKIGIGCDKKVYKTLRTPIEKIKRKDLENIPDKKSGSKDIYETLVNWFGNHETGEEALKANGNKYPISPSDKEHKEIRKIKLYMEYKNTGHMINNGNVEKGGIYRIDVFKSKNIDDDKLYFAAYDILEIKKINTIKKKKIKDEIFNIKLDYGRDKNTIILPYIDVIEKYNLYISLNKNDLVKITTKNSKESIAYVVGCSSGKIEVKSKLGDGYDIVNSNINKNNIFNKQMERYMITVSTIKEIKKLSINLLGEISGI